MKLQNLTHILIGIFCIGLLTRAQAVVPPPDGSYPNFTTAEGQKALFSLTTGAANTAVGWYSLFSDTAGSFNTAVGAGTLVLNTGDENTAIGTAALLFETTGGGNTAVGAGALLNNTDGGANTADGGHALVENTSGVANTAIGSYALYLNTTGSHNIALGVSTGGGVTTADNVIVIGTDGEDVSNSCYIGNIFGVTSASGTPVYINSVGKVATTTSSRRFKERIKPMERTSEALFGLQPVTFNYKKEIDPAATSQFGLVAEDVEKVSPDLVVRDKEGKPYSVRYDQVNAMLLNEFLKEHREVQELKKEVAALTAGLQKVNAELEASKPAPQVVNNP